MVNGSGGVSLLFQPVTSDQQPLPPPVAIALSQLEPFAQLPDLPMLVPQALVNASVWRGTSGVFVANTSYIACLGYQDFAGLSAVVRSDSSARSQAIHRRAKSVHRLPQRQLPT